MKAILKGIEKMKNKELKSKIISESFSLSLGGQVEVKKGNFKSSFTYSCYVYELKDFNNLFYIDDLYIEDDYYFFNDLKIDSIEKFRSTINGLGINEIQNIFEISESEKIKFATESINKHEVLKKINSNFILLNTLTDEDKRKLLFESKSIEELKKINKYTLGMFKLTQEDFNKINNNN